MTCEIDFLSGLETTLSQAPNGNSTRSKILCSQVAIAYLTQRLIAISQRLMEKHGVTTELIRPIDHNIATSVWPDMREHGWSSDEWMESGSGK